MSVQSCIDELKNIQENLLNFMDGDSSVEEIFQNLNSLLINKNICDNSSKFKLFLHLVSQISNNHQRGPNFFTKIEKIFDLFKDNINNFFSNMQIFNIFKKNKRILLFLIESKILFIDENIAQKILTTPKFIKYQYPQYFAPEIKPFIDKPWFIEIQKKAEKNSDNWINEISKELPENFNEDRKTGENNDTVCKLIREDQIKEFIVFVNKTNFPLNSTIKRSIYETNSFLNKQEKTSLIEYATFFGSIQIFKYLLSQNIELTSSLWFHAVHCQNSEIIHILEENHIEPKVKNIVKKRFSYKTKKEENENVSYFECLKESVKCHSNETVNYIINNFLEDSNIVKESIKYYNFNFLELENIDESLFYSCFKYEYYDIVCFLLKNTTVDVNEIEEINKGDLKIEKNPLIVAVENDNIELVKLLLQNQDIDVNVLSKEYLDQDYEQSINEDIENPWPEEGNSIDQYDLEKNYCKNKSIEIKKSSLIIAVEHENIEIIKLLLNNKNIDLKIKYDLHQHFEFNGTPEGRLKKDKKETKTALFIAVENENIEVIKLLLNGCDDELNDKSLSWGINDYYRGDIWNEDKEMSSSKTALFLAVEKDNIEIVELLSQNKNINAKCSCKREWHYLKDDWNCHSFDGEKYEENKSIYEEKTSLIAAIENNNIEIIRLLLQNSNIDLNIKCNSESKWSKVPIGEKDKHCSCSTISPKEEEENERIVGHINNNTIDAKNALDVAAYFGNSEIIKLLKEHK